jgi:hypothetical protein
MNTGKIFWGVFFIVAGALLLIDRLGLLLIDFSTAWRFWPLVLILWGASLLVPSPKARWFAAGFGAVALAILVVAFVHMIWEPDFAGWDSEVTRQEFVEKFEGPVDRAVLRLDAGVGSFIIEDTTDHLFTATARSSFGEFDIRRESRNGEETISMEMIGGRRLRIGRIQNYVRMRLSPEPVWEIDIDAGAAKIQLDVSPLKVRTVLVNSGASSITVRMGSRLDHSKVMVDAGASSIRLEVPEEVGCSLFVDAPLSSKSISGFTKTGEGLYETEDYRTAERRIEVTIDAGVSSLRVTRY